VTPLHAVVPDGIDDPARPSGGNLYDSRVIRGLESLGRPVHVHAVPGSWPRTDTVSLAALAAVLGAIPDADIVLVDGLVASPAPHVVLPESRRLRLVVLVHMPLGQGAADADTASGEGAVLSAAARIVTTSHWARSVLLDLHGLPAERVHVAEPGVDAAEIAPGTATGGALLCVAAVIPGKGHDVLVDALAGIAEIGWECVCAGTVDRDPGFAESLRRRMSAAGLAGRIRFEGAVPRAELDRMYAAADVLVLASRGETYGMVVTEALARGLPVVATDVGGIPEALGRAADGTRPGLLVPPDDARALAAQLRAWLTDDDLRRGLRRAAARRRSTLPGWSTTTSLIAGALEGAAR
jgi:glycosyltransferase involved in cell wall biosynthesis